MRHRILDTFTGPFALIQDDDGTVRTTWMNVDAHRMLKHSRLDRRLLPELTGRLNRYFEGEAIDFDDVALPEGGEFHRRCWRACRRIPAGETRSYMQLAKMAGSPAAARAAGQAMRNNCQPIITPCHRVIGSRGNLHGFGGTTQSGSEELTIKQALLEMERALVLAAR